MSKRGAEYRKCDFQIHSPRDAAWDGARPEDALPKDATNEDRESARENFCKTFIGKCVERGLGAIALTDHHEGVYAYKAIETLRKMKSKDLSIDLWILPGMELTCKDSCQALILFDADLHQILFEKARNKLGLVADTKPDSKVGIKIDLLEHNCEELQELLDGDIELRNRFIILPHVKPQGHKTAIRDGFHKRYQQFPYVGGYMDQCYPSDLRQKDQAKISGESKDWSTEKRGVISCSDARSADFALIGKHATWIKLAAPTAESLRQAMLAPEARVRYEEPKLPAVVINSAAWRGSKYLADGTYYFNQQMNSVIGGRGAGKSTLLEYIRFSLGCSAIDDSSASSSVASERLAEILDNTLDPETGAVELEVLLNGAPVRLKREMAKRSVITVSAQGAETLSTVEDVRTLIPTQQFRQGELSDLARDDAEKRLLALITGEASQMLSEVDTKLKKNAQSLSESLSKAVRLSAARQVRAHAETQIKLLRAQVDNLKKQLTDSGQAPSQSVEDHDKFMRQQAALVSMRSSLERGRLQAEKILSDSTRDIGEAASGQPLFLDIPELVGVFSSLKDTTGQEFISLVALRGQVVKWFDDQLFKLTLADAAWEPIFKQHQADYEEQKKMLAGKQSVIEAIENLSSKERESVKHLELSKQEEAELSDADNQLNKLRSERTELETTLTVTVAEQLKKIETASSGLARGVLAEIPNLDHISEAIRRALDLPQMREGRMEGLIRIVREADDKATKWREIQDEMLLLLKWKEGAPTEKGQPPVTPILHGVLDDGFMEKLHERVSLDRVLQVLTAIVRPRANISHLRKGQPIEFRRASQGEQAASLLNILMNQSNGPLIIDQPEEDLDNKIINEIIDTIAAAKNERQLIMATHNSNIVVNGDSENVIEMVLGQQTSAGAIDEENVRLAITETMEGGKDAFELRRRKYNF